MLQNSLNSKLGTTPVSSLSIICDRVISAKTDPVWKRAVLPLFLRKGALCAESFYGRLRRKWNKNLVRDIKIIGRKN